jgi:hypothetical protein
MFTESLQRMACKAVARVDIRGFSKRFLFWKNSAKWQKKSNE